uniref:Uncharacterized protein n=1 Tax=Anguilla anguilla TaxID=7936 RepID=A0A0E9VEQ5_ANGAN
MYLQNGSHGGGVQHKRNPHVTT